MPEEEPTARPENSHLTLEERETDRTDDLKSAPVPKDRVSGTMSFPGKPIFRRLEGLVPLISWGIVRSPGAFDCESTEVQCYADWSGCQLSDVLLACVDAGRRRGGTAAR